MKKSDLKVGYVVEYRNGYFRMIFPTYNGDLVLKPAADSTYCSLSEYDDDLIFWGASGHGLDIVRVYGYGDECSASYASYIGRKLLWERKEPKKMTVKEICDALGYEVEIVKDGADQ